MKKNERISISIYKPVCKHLQFSITEYHDGYIDEDSRCDITLEKCKEKGCKNKEYKPGGKTFEELEDRITRELCVDGKTYTCEECRYKNIPLICAGVRKSYKRVAKKILNSLIK